MSELNQIPDDLQAPPSHLTETARDFFLHIVGNGSYDAPARALLVKFCEVRDQLETVRGELAGKSICFTDKHGQPRIHPLAKHELALTNEYGKLFRLLGWDQAPPEGQQLFLFAPKNRRA